MMNYRTHAPNGALPSESKHRTSNITGELPPASPTISVIVPVYNGGSKFHACLESIAQAWPQPHELIVVADGDTDGSRDLARTYGAHVIIRPIPGGPAVARNMGAQAATGDILFFLDADCTIAPDAIAQVAAAFRTAPQTAALIGSYDDMPAEPDFLSQYKNLLHHYTHQTGREEAFTFWGACGAIRRDIFLDIGGFDERYEKPSIEDIELGYRLARRGYRIRLHKTLQIKHLKRWTALSLLRTDVFQRALPWTDLIVRDGKLPNDLNLQYASRLSVVCVFGLVASVLAALLRPKALLAALGLIVALIGLNFPLYRFFARKRGMGFAARVAPWHWLYYLYSGLAFGIGNVRHGVSKRFGRGQS